MRQKIVEASCWLLLGLGLYSISWVIFGKSKNSTPTVVKRTPSVITRIDKKTKNSSELTPKQKDRESLAKISKPISMKLISGKMPLTATYSTTSQSKNDNEIVYDMGIQCQITSYSFGLTCSGPILTTCHWYLYASNNKKEWKLVADGDCQSNISHSGDHAIVSGNIISTTAFRYVMWRVVAKGAMMPGLYTLTISNPRLCGIKMKGVK